MRSWPPRPPPPTPRGSRCRAAKPGRDKLSPASPDPSPVTRRPPVSDSRLIPKDSVLSFEPYHKKRGPWGRVCKKVTKSRDGGKGSFSYGVNPPWHKRRTDRDPQSRGSETPACADCPHVPPPGPGWCAVGAEGSPCCCCCKRWLRVTQAHCRAGGRKSKEPNELQNRCQEAPVPAGVLGKNLFPCLLQLLEATLTPWPMALPPPSKPIAPASASPSVSFS